MTILRFLIFPVLSGLILSGCNGFAYDGNSKEAETEVSPAIEYYEHFEEYIAATAALMQEYSLTTGQNTAGLVSPDDESFQTGRILVTTDGNLTEPMGAVRVLHYGDEYVLQFRTAQEARDAYVAMQSAGIYREVSPDILFDPYAGVRP